MPSGGSRWRAVNLPAAGSASAEGEQLRAREVACPLLVALRGPAALAHEQLPQVGEVDRPQHVGRPVDVQARPEGALRVQALDDRTLNCMEVRVDPLPEG